MYDNVYTENPLLIVGIGATSGQKPNLSVLNQEMFRRLSAALQLESTASVQQQSTLKSAAQIHLCLHSLPQGCREAQTIHTCSPTTGALSRRGATAACRLQRRPTAKGGALLPAVVKVCSCAVSHHLTQQVESGFASFDKKQRNSVNRLVSGTCTAGYINPVCPSPLFTPLIKVSYKSVFKELELTKPTVN